MRTAAGPDRVAGGAQTVAGAARHRAHLRPARRRRGARAASAGAPARATAAEPLQARARHLDGAPAQPQLRPPVPRRGGGHCAGVRRGIASPARWPSAPLPRRARRSGDHGDRALAARAGRGDERAFAELYDRHAAGLLAFASQYVGDRAAAEDVVQQTFMAAYRVLSEGTELEHPRAWLYRVARNNALTTIRDRGRRASMPSSPRSCTTAPPRFRRRSSGARRCRRWCATSSRCRPSSARRWRCTSSATCRRRRSRTRSAASPHGSRRSSSRPGRRS